MNKTNVAALVRYLSAAYPNNRIKDTNELVEAWADALKPYSKSEIQEAARSIVRTSKFFPTISEIIERIVPAQYELHGIPEEPVDAKVLKEKIDRAVDTERKRLGRSLSAEEYKDIADEIVKIDEMRRKFTRPFEFERNAK